MTIKVIRPDILHNENHPEREEKDVIDAKTKTSEDVHGGDEITQSMQDQRFAQQTQQRNDLLQCNNTQLEYNQSHNNNDQQTNDSNTQSEQQLVQQNDITQQQTDQNTSSQSDDKQTDQQNNNQQNINDGSQQNEWDNETKQQNIDTQLDQQAEEQQNNNNNQQLIQQNETIEDNNETNQQQTDQQKDESQDNKVQQTNENDTQSEQQNDQNKTEDDNETEERTLDDSVSDDYQEQEVEEQEYDNEEEQDDYYEDVEEQEDTLQYNTQQAFKINGERNVKRQLYLTFYRLVEYLSDEEKQPTLLPGQALIWNVKKLMMRQYERKPLNAYYYYRTRSQVVLILDTSGSMEWLIDELDTFFKAALKRKDVQIYVAPNGNIEEYYNDKTKLFEPIYHDYAIQQIIRSGLPIIYVGDFDGANTPIELSWNNRVYWICTETRYKYFSHHNWVGRCLKADVFGNCEDFRPYYEEDFKGFFGRAFNDEEIIKVLKEFAKNVYKQRFWYDNHYIEDFSEER
jgi:chemotaxis protein histidine kinase CheA